MKLGIVANCQKPAVIAKLKELRELAAANDVSLLTTGETCGHLSGCQQLDHHAFTREVDFLLTLGGDGTMLSAVRMLEGADVPIIGLNLGKLGFLTSIIEGQLGEAIKALKSGEFSISKRTMTECILPDGSSYHSLNDIVLGWGSSSRIASIAVGIDGLPMTTYTCDGLIIATPTGSTGHSLSAGGPIIKPGSPVWVINVICPHTLSTRPLIISDESTIELVVEESSKDLVLAIDGQAVGEMKPGDRMEIRKSKHAARFVHLKNYDYFNVLRKKLHWRGSNIHSA